MWMYDLDNLAADIGGFMGLLLGASIYTFADLLVTAIEKMIMKKQNNKFVCLYLCKFVYTTYLFKHVYWQQILEDS